MQKGTKLKKLSLFANHLGDTGASDIAEALSAGSYVHLQELDMSANDIGTLGVRHLCDVLESQAAPALEVTSPPRATHLQLLTEEQCWCICSRSCSLLGAQTLMCSYTRVWLFTAKKRKSQTKGEIV